MPTKFQANDRVTLNSVAQAIATIIDRGPIGDQYVMPGAERESVGKILQRRADKPLRPTRAQLPCDLGLFSDDADQTDLLLEIWEPGP